ncbi:hypothetical protein A3E89_02860 [Candidatus Campbellbacteria bacterium RIFCSPHIGHO2_12_FULL_35_10]|uniref:Uncharacterized protein n=1 Tax=Candidatus Campbellbacteria bacterium RIFCSPHIGHO2_12_FULL_35_10 TaxID=1797578 RepID=A0A1F5ELV8_9BACT|nr:MAG: hypothetical protein A3E89_02860 [Candidatus Campbellbacteria bacterium RIFCSPHIGHO2_12_FULL_35_10]
MEYTFTINFLGWPIGITLIILSIVFILMYLECPSFTMHDGYISGFFLKWSFYILSIIVFILTLLWIAIRVYRGG